MRLPSLVTGSHSLCSALAPDVAKASVEASVAIHPRGTPQPAGPSGTLVAPVSSTIWYFYGEEAYRPHFNFFASYLSCQIFILYKTTMGL